MSGSFVPPMSAPVAPAQGRSVSPLSRKPGVAMPARPPPTAQQVAVAPPVGQQPPSQQAGQVSQRAPSVGSIALPTPLPTQRSLTPVNPFGATQPAPPPPMMM